MARRAIKRMLDLGVSRKLIEFTEAKGKYTIQGSAAESRNIGVTRDDCVPKSGSDESLRSRKLHC